MFIFYAKVNPKDNEMVEIYTKTPLRETVWCVVHIDFFYNHSDYYDRLKQGEELELRIIE